MALEPSLTIAFYEHFQLWDSNSQRLSNVPFQGNSLSRFNDTGSSALSFQ
jgi:hypothetical protein